MDRVNINWEDGLAISSPEPTTEAKINIPTRRERSIEQAVVTYAQRKGIEVRKLQAMRQVGWPDRSFFLNYGIWFMIEFKRPKKKPSKTQAITIKMLRDRGYHAYVVSDVATGKRLVDKYLRREARARHAEV